MKLGIPAGALLAVALGASSTRGEMLDSVSTPPSWSYRFDATVNVLPDQPDYLQPTLTADRGTLHLEGRYNYEELESASGFVGWNYETGSQVTLTLTPMLGGVAGRMHGVIPALEFTLGWHELELYAESEYVVDLGQSSGSFFYHWSELALSPADWISAGVVIQRSRLIHNSREIQSGPLVRLTKWPIEAAAYFVNPGSSDRYFLGSIALSFPFR